jgi:hypothetical protein
MEQEYYDNENLEPLRYDNVEQILNHYKDSIKVIPLPFIEFKNFKM